MGLHCVGKPFVADSVGSCSHWCKTVKDLGGPENSLCSVGREGEESYKKKMIFQQISFFVNVLMKMIYFHDNIWCIKTGCSL